MTYWTTAAISAVLVQGATLHACNVTAGGGLVIDWRTVKGGDTVISEADAFDVARMFIALVGEEQALKSVRRLDEDARYARMISRQTRPTSSSVAAADLCGSSSGEE